MSALPTDTDCTPYPRGAFLVAWHSPSGDYTDGNSNLHPNYYGSPGLTRSRETLSSPMSIRTPTRVDVAFVGAVCRGIGKAMSEHKYRWATEFVIGAGLIFVLYEMVQVGETVPATVLSGAFVVRYGVTAAEISEGVRYAMAQADDRRKEEYGTVTETPGDDPRERQ